MTFGPNSNNPRERRSYAHTMLAKARASGETVDFEAAHEAVADAGLSHKAQAHNFGASLLNLALQDHPTASLVEHGRWIIANLLPPQVRAESEQRAREFLQKLPGPYSEVTWHVADAEPGTFLHAVITFTFDPHEDKMRVDLLELDRTFYPSDTGEKARETYRVPLRPEVDDVDIIRTRRIPDNERIHMRALMEQVVLPQQPAPAQA